MRYKKPMKDAKVAELLTYGIKMDQQNSAQFLAEIFEHENTVDDVEIQICYMLANLDYQAFIEQGYYQGVHSYHQLMWQYECESDKAPVHGPLVEFYWKKHPKAETSGYDMPFDLPVLIREAALKDNNLTVACEANVNYGSYELGDTEEEIATHHFNTNKWFDKVIEAAVTQEKWDIAKLCLNYQLNKTDNRHYTGFPSTSEEYQAAKKKLTAVKRAETISANNPLPDWLQEIKNSFAPESAAGVKAAPYTNG